MSLWLLLSEANSGAGLTSAYYTGFPRWESCFLLVFPPIDRHCERTDLLTKLPLWGSSGPCCWSKSSLLYIYSKVTLPRRTCQLKWLHIYTEIQSHSCNALADGRIEQCNWVNELHALIFCSFTLAARGVTNIALLHGLLYVWGVPQRRSLIKQSNFLLANCFEVWSKERKGEKKRLIFCIVFPCHGRWSNVRLRVCKVGKISHELLDTFEWNSQKELDMYPKL